MHKSLWLMMALALAAAGENLRVPVWVDSESDGTSALTPLNLNIRAGGATAHAASALGPADDLMVMVISDMVGDLTSAQIAKTSLIESSRQLPPHTLLAMLRSQDGLRVLMDPTADRDRFSEAVRAVPVSGRAGLLDTIETAARIGDGILSKAAVRLAILYVTDSDVANYREDLVNPRVNPSDRGDMSRRFPDVLVRERISKLDSTLARTRVPVFILHLAYRNDSLNDAYQTGLMTLAATTGGASYFCRSQKDIPDLMDAALRTIASHYSVDVALPPEAKSSVLTLQLESPGRTLRWRDRFVLQAN